MRPIEIRHEKVKHVPHRHTCPKCEGRSLTRVKRAGAVDWLLASLFGLRPYVCDDCGRKTHSRPEK